MSGERVVRGAEAALAEGGLRGSFLVRELATGEEVGIDPDRLLPAASLVKVPLAIAVLELAARGELDLTAPVAIAPGRVTARGPAGVSKFRHPATIAVEDLLHLAVAVSDNTAADALFALVPPAAVTAELRRLGHDGITVRHHMGDLTSTPAESFAPDQRHLAHALAITATTSGHGHPVAQLDVARASTGTARAFTDLLHGLWAPSAIDAGVAARVRELMGDTVMRQRLAPDFTSDAATWSSKTGTLLNLRHEVGVVEHADGQTYLVTALTESMVPAVHQPAAEALMGQVARELHDHLRAG